MLDFGSESKIDIILKIPIKVSFLYFSIKLDLPDEKFDLIFIIFYQNDGLNEFLSKSLCLFVKLWNEMKAQILDFDRVIFLNSF